MNPIIPLRVASLVEPQASWEGISTPHELAKWLSRILSVDATKLAETQEIVFGDLQPQGDDQNKIWVKTSEPVGFGLPVGDSYTIIYQYPPNVPLLWAGSDATIPSYLTTLSEDQITSFGLSTPNKGTWVIFNP